MAIYCVIKRAYTKVKSNCNLKIAEEKTIWHKMNSKGGSFEMQGITIRPNLSRGAQILSLIMIIIVGVISNYIYVLSVYVGPLNEAHGWSMNMIVATYSMSMFCEFPAFLFGGIFINKFGMKKVLTVCGVMYGLAILLSGLATNVIVFIITQGIMGALAMYGVFIATLSIINVLYPERKGLVMGILYGSQAAGGALMAPLANFFIETFNVSMALIWQGVIFTIIMFICCMLVSDPTKGDRNLQARIQEEVEDAEAEAAVAGKTNEQLPTMGWKKALTHPALWLVFLSIIAIQMIGNVLITNIPYLAEGNYGVSAAESAWVVSAFSIGAGIGGIVVGFVSDKIGPYKTTFLLGIFDGIVLAILAAFGAESFILFAIICIVQGATYNGITTLNPIMVTDSYLAKDIGTVMAFTGLAIIIVGVIGPQMGLSLPFIPMLVVCAGLSIVGGILAKVAAATLNKYYRSIDSKCVVK